MRYKAYYDNGTAFTNVPGWQEKAVQHSNDVGKHEFIDEDEDLHILQSRIQEKAAKSDNRLLYIQKVKIVDTLYEERFNKKQEELQRHTTEYVAQSLSSVLSQFVGKPVTSETLSKLRIAVTKALSQHPMFVGLPISESEIIIKNLGQNKFELSLPTYGMISIDFTL
jgi:hypothetical protein